MAKAAQATPAKPGRSVSPTGRARGALLRWYRRARRDLPWRHTSDPYRVWISEAMLQQTRVETVIPYYHRFLDRFPDVAALAGAELDDVLGAWQGLGYYSRARNLKRAAEHVVECCGGELPDTADALRELPGVGRYTAGAVASIAFDRPEPIVDGNVARVLSRFHGLTEDPKSRAGQKRLWEEAERLVRGRSPGDLNQALMELGATVCTPRSPECPRCPVRADCVALRGGDPEALPAGGKRPKVRDITAVAALVERRGRVLAVRRPETGLLGGLWDLPGEISRPARIPMRAWSARCAKAWAWRSVPSNRSARSVTCSPIADSRSTCTVAAPMPAVFDSMASTPTVGSRTKHSRPCRLAT